MRRDLSLAHRPSKFVQLSMFWDQGCPWPCIYGLSASSGVRPFEPGSMSRKCYFAASFWVSWLTSPFLGRPILSLSFYWTSLRPIGSSWAGLMWFGLILGTTSLIMTIMIPLLNPSMVCELAFGEEKYFHHICFVFGKANWQIVLLVFSTRTYN